MFEAERDDRRRICHVRASSRHRTNPVQTARRHVLHSRQHHQSQRCAGRRDRRRLGLHGERHGVASQLARRHRDGLHLGRRAGRANRPGAVTLRQLHAHCGPQRAEPQNVSVDDRLPGGSDGAAGPVNKPRRLADLPPAREVHVRGPADGHCRVRRHGLLPDQLSRTARRRRSGRTGAPAGSRGREFGCRHAAPPKRLRPSTKATT